MFPLLSMAGVIVLALRADHRRRLDAIQAERAERSERRSVSRPGVVPLIIHVNDEAAVNVNGETFTEPNLNKANAVRRQSRAEAMTAALAFMQQNPDASLAEIGQAAGRSKAWAASITSEMMASGRVCRNLFPVAPGPQRHCDKRHEEWVKGKTTFERRMTWRIRQHDTSQGCASPNAKSTSNTLPRRTDQSPYWPGAQAPAFHTMTTSPCGGGAVAFPASDHIVIAPSQPHSGCSRFRSRTPHSWRLNG